MAQAISINSDNLLRVDSVSDASSGGFINNATVTFDVKEVDGTVIDSGTCTYVTGSDGRYEGNIADTLDLEQGQQLFVEVTVISGTSKSFRRINAGAAYRGEGD